jgi:hypothetical protein
MTTSDSINEIAAALAKAQGQMTGALKDAANPFFKSKYADLASVWEACRTPLATNGIAVVQSPTVNEMRVSLDTLLVHTSGQWIRNSLSCAVKDDSPQVIGSATTYLRRYALQSLVGVAAEDDDGEAAEGRNKPSAHARTPALVQHPPGFLDWLDDLAAVAAEGTARLEKTWKSSKPEYRQHLTTTDPKRWESIKAHAAKSAEAVSA